MPDSLSPGVEIPNNTPWQFKFAVFFGVPSVICIYLVWWLTANIDGQVKLILNNQNSINQASAIQAQDNTRAHEQILAQFRQFNNLQVTLQQICVNTSTTASDRAACFKVLNPSY